MGKTLWQFQVEGAAFLAQSKRGILADEMGLGKTIQAVMAAKVLGVQEMLVLCPLNAKHVWKKEVEDMGLSVRLTVVTYQSAFIPHKGKNPQAIVRPELLRRWELVVLDEAHYLSNASAQSTQAVYGRIVPSAGRAWMLSGTPVRKHYGDVYPMLRSMGVWNSSRAHFEREFCITRWGRNKEEVVGSKNPDKLRALWAPYILRRTKKDVDMQLPRIRVEVTEVDPGPVDIDRHFPLVSAGVEDWSEVQVQIDEQQSVLAGIIKQLGGSDSVLDAVGHMQAKMQSYGKFTGLQKVPATVEMAEEILATGDKVVIFAYHQVVIRELCRRLSKYNPVLVWGQTTSAGRRAAEDKFQNHKDVRVFIGQLRSAGTAITLTAACEALFCEVLWVPSDNAQCVMRINRIGQTRACRARLVTLAGNEEEKALHRTLRRRTEEICDLYGETESATGHALF